MVTPAANLFRRRQARAPADKLFVHVLGFGRENIFVEPVVESDVIVQAAKQGHGDVGVAVDESGQDELAFGVDGLRSGVPGFEFATGADSHDRVTLYGHGAIVEDRAAAVHSDDGAAGDQQVGFFFVGLRSE